MVKKILYLLMVMLILIGYGECRTVTAAEKSEETQESLNDWEIEFTEEMLQKLPDIPDWNSQNAYIEFLEAYKPSKEILRIYEQKKEKDELLAGGYLDIHYQGEKINYIPPYYEESYVFAMFKQNNSLVKAHQVDRSIVIQYSDGHEEKIELDVIPEGYILLTTVSVDEGHYSELFDGFSICYNKSSGEVVCVKFDEEIGKKVKISSKDIDEFLNREEAIESYPYLGIGYINHNNELVYPTIIEDETGIRFEILKKKLKDQEEQLIYFSSAIVDNINFKVYNNNVYRIDNVKRRVCLDVSQGFCYGIWTIGEAKIEEIPVDYSSIKNIEIEVISRYSGEQEIEVCVCDEDMTIFGKDTYMYQGQFENDKFQEYLWDEGVWDIGGWIHSSNSFKYDNWIEAEPTLVQLKEEIIKQGEEN